MVESFLQAYPGGHILGPFYVRYLFIFSVMCAMDALTKDTRFRFSESLFATAYFLGDETKICWDNTRGGSDYRGTTCPGGLDVVFEINPDSITDDGAKVIMANEAHIFDSFSILTLETLQELTQMTSSDVPTPESFLTNQLGDKPNGSGQWTAEEFYVFILGKSPQTDSEMDFSTDVDTVQTAEAGQNVFYCTADPANPKCPFWHVNAHSCVVGGTTEMRPCVPWVKGTLPDPRESTGLRPATHSAAQL